MEAKRCEGCLTSEEKATVLGLSKAVGELLPKITEMIEKSDAAKAKDNAIKELKNTLINNLKTGVFVITGVSSVIAIILAVFGFLFNAFKNGFLK